MRYAMRDAGCGMPKARCVLALIMALALNAGAVEFIQTSTFFSGDPEVLRDEMWISADSVTVTGEALEDLFAAGGALDLRGTFRGAVWGAGNSASASGVFHDNLRLAGRLVQVAGTVHGSLTAAGTTVKIEPSASVAKNILCLGDHVISEGSVAGHARLIAQKATLGGKTAGNVSVAAQDIVVLPGTAIGGNLVYTAPRELVLPPTVQLGGELIRTFAAVPPRRILKPLGTHFLFGAAALLAGLVFCGLFPRYTEGAVNALRTAPGPCLLTGAAALVLIPTTALVLLFTLIGLPLSLLLFLFYFILLYLSKIAAGLWIGALVLRRKELSKRTLFSTLAAGLLILYALTAVKAASLLVGLAVSVFGLGALILALFRRPVLVIQRPADVQPTTMEE